MVDIQSRQNAKIKEIRSLRQRKQRKAKKLFIVEGIRHIGEALDANANIEYVLAAPELLKSDYANSLLAKIEEKGISLFTTTPEILVSLSEKENPQGLLAVANQLIYSLEDFSSDQHPWLVALISPQDPGNIGTILRTIDAVGADGLILIDNSVDIFHPSAVRASMGALFWKPVISASIEEFTSWSSQNKYVIYGTSAKGKTLFNQVVYRSPAILLFGSEREGLSDDQINFCDHLLKLPMAGSASSLNLSVSSGVFLYEMHAQFNPE
ncbi:MAG: RNA methyltransferase [Chloroflexi bacterium]|jgi:RNA methyltransferase, TrmH family|nr:RNA methyltransferase [Chloroflexota bacterium]MBT3670519.1 RNA methyltransferase [Chloroflexota bacterium]MBT4002888.1 RNA methyltransferase [Chloroflexota bacterium]MBT4304454.1 RNA methyltransferase [Chloroflexota bacterium]MBT4532581.1 RNA methyltransferase [Chloroflexota bacterium]